MYLNTIQYIYNILEYYTVYNILEYYTVYNILEQCKQYKVYKKTMSRTMHAAIMK